VEVHVKPAMLAVLALRKLPGVFGANLRRGRLRSAGFAESTASATAVLWAEMARLFFGWARYGDVFTAYSQDYKLEHRGQVSAAEAKW